MKVNEYNNLKEFIYEYDSGRHSSIDNSHGRKFGIEFCYNGVYYRMCREPMEDSERPRLKNCSLGFYQVTIMNCEKFGYPIADEFESVGWYSDIYDLLENCTIGDKKFKDVIIADETKILSKD